MNIEEFWRFLDLFKRVDVINCVGTSEDVPPFWATDWKDYWQKQSRREMIECSHCGATEDLVGAHVTMVGDPFKWDYIVPLCKKCNKIGVGNRDESNLTFFDVRKSDLVKL